jgi:hypothetical protein
MTYAVLSSIEECEKCQYFHQCVCTGYAFCYMSETGRVVSSPASVVGISLPQNSNDCISEGFYHEISSHTYGKRHALPFFFLSPEK